MEAHSIDAGRGDLSVPRAKDGGVAAGVCVVMREFERLLTGAFTVLGTIIGAYFGVRVGARGKEDAEAARVVAATKVERLAAHVDAAEAEQVLDAVDHAAQEGTLRPRRS